MATMNEVMCYVARKSCGCIIAATVDEPDMQKENAKEVARWMRKGFTVDRVTVQHVRDNFEGRYCPHEPEPPEQTQLF